MDLTRCSRLGFAGPHPKSTESEVFLGFKDLYIPEIGYIPNNIPIIEILGYPNYREDSQLFVKVCLKMLGIFPMK